jgi:hypothetical protein
MGQFNTYIFISGLLFSQLVFAADTSQINVTISQTNYGGRAQIDEQDSQYSSVTPSFTFFKRYGAIEGTSHVFRTEGLVVLPMSDSVDLGVALPEAYYQMAVKTDSAKNFKFSVGRKLENWSELDNHWNIGLWQPLVRWDAANPIEQGLTGLFFEFGKSDSVRLVVMVSGLYLPDQQPSYDVVDGRIVSANRWFRAPVASASLENSQGEIAYDVIEPEAKDVLAQNSYAAMLMLGDPDAGGFLKFSTTDKPANQFHLGIDMEGILNINNANAISFQAPVYAVNVRHKINTIEFGNRFADSKVTLSANFEYYEKPNLPEKWQQTQLADSRYAGIIYDTSLKPIGLKRSSLSVSYVVNDQIDKPSEKATLIKGDIEASTQRFLFEEMVGVELKSNLLNTYRRAVDVRLKYVYSIIDSGEWLQAGLQYRQDRDWTWGLSGDLFGVPEDTKSSTSFISKFRGNDRLMGSLTYVF